MPGEELIVNASRFFRVNQRARVGLAALILVSFFNAPAEARRVGAQPLILLFQDGYGIIAAEVLQASPVKVEGQHRYPYRYRVTFLVHEIIAQPVKGPAFPLTPKETLAVEITVGYACMIEDWGGREGLAGGKNATRKAGPLAAGRRYYLTVRLDPATGTYTHAGGASILQPVKDFPAQRDSDIQATRALAALAAGPRIQRCQELLLDPKTSQFVRFQALAETRHRLQRSDPASDAERRAIVAFCWKLWKGDTSHLDLTFLSTLDFTMRVTLHGFARSAERRDVWLDRVCAPLKGQTSAQRHAECKQRNQYITHLIVDTGKIHPAQVGARLMSELRNPERLVPSQVLLVHCLLQLYRGVAAPLKAWEPFLQDYLPRLTSRCGSYPLDLLAWFLEAAVRPPRRQERRAFRPNRNVVDALRRARDRMHKLIASEASTDRSPTTALNRLGKLLSSLR